MVKAETAVSPRLAKGELDGPLAAPLIDALHVSQQVVDGDEDWVAWLSFVVLKMKVPVCFADNTWWWTNLPGLPSVPFRP